MYKREICAGPERIIQNKKPIFGTWNTLPDKLDISGVRAPYLAIPMPAIFTRLRIRARLISYELSEKFDTPVLIKMCTRVAHSQSIVDTEDRKEVAVKTYEKNIAKYVMSPANAIKKHPVVEQRTKDLTAWAETSSVNKTENNNSKIGIITHSTSYQYVKEIFGDSVELQAPVL